MKVNVFISWSGDYSREIAKILHAWLTRALIFVKPYYSSDDIIKGTRWSSDISKQLEITNVGLLIITSGNFNSSWISFEAGALSRKVDQSRVCPILFDLRPSELAGPLTQFQTALFNKEDMLKVIKMLNLEAGDLILQNDVLTEVFNQWWPQLETEINKIPKDVRVSTSKRNISDINNEILEKLRSIERINDTSINYLNKEFAILDQLINIFEKLVFCINQIPSNSYYNLELILLEMLNPIHDFLVNAQRNTISIKETEFIFLAQKIKVIKKVIFEMNEIDHE